jgi:hypothetical protein
LFTAGSQSKKEAEKEVPLPISILLARHFMNRLALPIERTSKKVLAGNLNMKADFGSQSIKSGMFKTNKKNKYHHNQIWRKNENEKY